MKQIIDLNEYVISPQKIELYEDYRKEVCKWDKLTDLIGASEKDDFFSRHILNCLALNFLLKSSDKIIYDIGTGAGLPGIVLALSDDTDRQYVLFEKKYQKRSFLMNMVARYQLKNVRIAEQFPHVSRETCDILTSRAYLSLLDMQKHQSYYRKFILFKGKNYLDEIALVNNKKMQDNLSIYKISSNDSFLLLGDKNECFT